MKIGQFHDLLSCLRFSMSSSGIYLSGAMRSEQPKARRRRASEAYAVRTLRMPEDGDRRHATLIVAPLFAVEELRQPKRHARPDVHAGQAQYDDQHIRHHPG